MTVVGQAPGPNTDPSEPLSGASGRRLAALCGLTYAEFRRRFRLVNVLDGHPGRSGKGCAFPSAEARKSASDLLMGMAGHPTVLLGRAVPAAFGLAAAPWFEWRQSGGWPVAATPHPSGISHWWNEPANVRRARRFWRRLARAAAPGP